MKDERRGIGADKEEFLARWSRLKQETKEQPPAAVPAPKSGQKSDSPPAELPPLEKLTLESDYRGFFHPKVDESLRRAALKKLFGDPHFNVMDGLDVYIDDYSKSDPLPAAMLSQLKQAEKILDWAREKKEAPEESVRDSAKPASPATDTKRVAAAEPAASDTTATTARPQAADTEPAEVRPPRRAG